VLTPALRALAKFNVETGLVRGRFTRHATAHRAGTTQYTLANAVIAIMLATSLSRNRRNQGGEVGYHQATAQACAVRSACRVVRRSAWEILVEEGEPIDRIRAVLVHTNWPSRVDRALAQLRTLVDRPDFRRLAETVMRARRIVPSGTPSTYDPVALTESAEISHGTNCGSDLHQTRGGSGVESLSGCWVGAPRRGSASAVGWCSLSSPVDSG
jgi:hypothetical protein